MSSIVASGQKRKFHHRIYTQITNNTPIASQPLSPPQKRFVYLPIATNGEMKPLLRRTGPLLSIHSPAPSSPQSFAEPISREPTPTPALLSVAAVGSEPQAGTSESRSLPSNNEPIERLRSPLGRSSGLSSSTPSFAPRPESNRGPPSPSAAVERPRRLLSPNEASSGASAETKPIHESPSAGDNQNHHGSSVAEGPRTKSGTGVSSETPDWSVGNATPSRPPSDKAPSTTMDSLERQSAGGLLVSAPSDSKTDAKVAEPGASHPSSVLSEKKKEAKPRQDPTLPRPKDNRHISKRSLLPCVDALTVIQSTSAHYISFDTAVSGGKRPNGFAIESIDLEYPGIDAVEKFPLVVPTKLGEYNPTHDIYTTTQMIVEFCIPKEHSSKFGDTKHGTLRKIIKSCHRRNVQDLRDGVAAFNAQLRELKKQGLFERCEGLGGAASPKLVSHILDQAYARSVAPYSNHLNNYREFSNNVYGEVKHSLVSEIIDRAKIQPHHVFLDMGSGIGNVVLQIAAQCLCESYGIEVMPIPSKLAKKQCKELLSRLRYYAKPCGKITLKQGDFLEDPEIHDVIRRADIIFVNNYAFDAQLNQRILHKFLDLKDTAKVVSLKNFVPIDRKVSLRRSNAIESIFSIEEHYFARDSVSWTNEGGRYFIHTVDRASLGELHKQL